MQSREENRQNPVRKSVRNLLKEEPGVLSNREETDQTESDRENNNPQIRHSCSTSTTLLTDWRQLENVYSIGVRYYRELLYVTQIVTLNIEERLQEVHYMQRPHIQQIRRVGIFFHSYDKVNTLSYKKGTSRTSKTRTPSSLLQKFLQLKY